MSRFMNSFAASLPGSQAFEELKRWDGTTMCYPPYLFWIAYEQRFPSFSNTCVVRQNGGGWGEMHAWRLMHFRYCTLAQSCKACPYRPPSPCPPLPLASCPSRVLIPIPAEYR